MRIPRSGAILASCLLTLAGCSVDVEQHRDRVAQHDHDDAPRYGMQRLVLVEPFESRAEAGEAASEAMDRLRGAGCEIVSADRWHEIDERNGPDLHGMRVSADCPQTARLF